MECNVCREALSARIDGEREPAAAAQVDAHVADCAECDRWYLAAVESTRRLRVRTLPATPDLTAAILDHLDLENPAGSLVDRPSVWRVVCRALRTALRALRLGFGPEPVYAPEPVDLPPGARYGRRRDHLRATRDPAA